MDVSREIPKMNMDLNETGCCPRFNSEVWDNRIFNFEDYRFVKTNTKSFLHMPINMGKVFTSTMKSIDAALASPNDKYLIISHDLSSWKAEHYFLVEKEVPNLTAAKLHGNYYSKVYEGEFKEFPKWMESIQQHAKNHGFDVEDYMAFYTTCPKCAKYYGKNYVVLLAKIKD